MKLYVFFCSLLLILIGTFGEGTSGENCLETIVTELSFSHMKDNFMKKLLEFIKEKKAPLNLISIYITTIQRKAVVMAYILQVIS